MRTIAKSLSFAPLLTFLACTSIDAERSQMEASIADANRLAMEITAWRGSVATGASDAEAAVVDSLEGFQDRSKAILGSLEGLSTEATAGVDLTGLQQALRTICEFDTSTYAPASVGARKALLDQFAGLARNLEGSATAVRA